MKRVLPTAFVLLLLAATAGAFAWIERVKLERRPVTDARIDSTFSPVCECPQAAANLSFRLTKPGRITVTVIDRDNRPVRVLLAAEAPPAGRIRLAWDGRDDAGRVVPDGLYRMRLLVKGQHNATIPQSGTIVDTRRPTARLVAAYPAVFSPDGDRRGDVLTVRYAFPTRAHALIRVNGRVRVEGRPTRKTGVVYWGGKSDGRSLPAGWYRISLQARDAAGNVSLPTESVRVRIRYIDLSRREIATKAGALVRLRMITDARRVRWRLVGPAGVEQQGVREPGAIAFRAPSEPGTYTFVVEANGRRREARVVVSAG